MPKRFTSALSVVVLTLLLLSLQCGCAAKKLAVRNADTLLSHQIQKRLPLYSSQRIELDKDIDHFLIERRPAVQEILPVLDSLSLQKEKIEPQYHALVNYYQRVELDFFKLFSKHMTPLDSIQQKKFLEKLDDEDKLLTAKDPDDRTEKIKENFKLLFGKMNEGQKQLLADYHQYFEDRNKARLHRRKKLHNDFKTIYESDVSLTTRRGMFINAFKDYQEGSLNHKKNIEMIQDLLPSLSAEQKEFFRNQLIELKEIITYFLTIDY